MENVEKIQFDEPSKFVQIHLPTGEVISGPRGSEVGDLLKPIIKEESIPILGAIINGKLSELSHCIDIESNVTPVTMSMADGMRIYRRSLTLLLEAAFEELYPDFAINIDHSVSFGGYYCQVKGPKPLLAEDINKLDLRMKQLVKEDQPIIKKEVPLDEVIEYFKEKGYQDKVRLLKHRRKDYLVLYFLGEHRDYHHGYMVPSTSYLKWFELEAIDNGFTLRFPRRHKPTEIMPLGDYPKLLHTFRQYGDWLERLGIQSVGSLNDAVKDGRIREVILVSEALHEQQIAEMAASIAARKETRVVLIAGPSSSGKTTTSRRLSVQLLSQGLQPYPLEMDNFFVDRDKTPKDESGEFNFEHIDAIARPRLNHDLKKLINAQEVQLPHYDFHTGKSNPGEMVKLGEDQVVIVEGIHGLNPDLIGDIPEEQVFRIYISALTQLNLDRHNRVSTTDTRLIRRIVRDAKSRGYSPQQTIQRWESVRKGEKNYIFPYQENADIMFNSALVYELSVLKRLAEPLLRQVPFGTPEHLEVKRLLALLEWFLPLDGNWIPDNSLLREFIGGSILKDFKLWRQS
ncbi:MAG: nucleoside kinase [Chloroflexi bacterium]|jgi:uridine kinase|nr:nucleoside kinase [Chloroflexota bacterium]MBT3668664.1 nucleoside kinase [Chloroflexota bacterium]MBT4003696.1 nucleoside kinase [Chloroflexota bacterium]MBT4305365.1 nucleoside kinase [Chloroflexota bacterium]MBT4532511.1 nucleoside kinase [Chloroflexota bacterium]